MFERNKNDMEQRMLDIEKRYDTKLSVFMETIEESCKEESKVVKQQFDKKIDSITKSLGTLKRTLKNSKTERMK